MIYPPDWHKPSNPDCPHNADPSLACGCKRKRTRKPFRTYRVQDLTAGHGCRKYFTVQMHPKGLLVIRETGRRSASAVTVTVAGVYEAALLRRARAAIFAKRLAKAERRKARRAKKRASTV